MTTLRDCITIKFTHIVKSETAPEPTTDQTELRRRFWQLLIEINKSNPILRFDELAWEQIFNRDFGRNLRKEMIKAMSLDSEEDSFNAKSSARPTCYYADLALVTFKLTIRAFEIPSSLGCQAGIQVWR